MYCIIPKKYSIFVLLFGRPHYQMKPSRCMKAIKTITILALFIIGSTTAGNSTGFTHNMVSAQKMLKEKKNSSNSKSEPSGKNNVEENKKEKSEKTGELQKSVSLNRFDSKSYVSSVLTSIVSSVVESVCKSNL